MSLACFFLKHSMFSLLWQQNRAKQFKLQSNYCSKDHVSRRKELHQMVLCTLTEPNIFQCCNSERTGFYSRAQVSQQLTCIKHKQQLKFTLISVISFDKFHVAIANSGRQSYLWAPESAILLINCTSQTHASSSSSLAVRHAYSAKNWIQYEIDVLDL